MVYGANRGYVLEFIFKEGVEEKLFDHEIMALGKGKLKVKNHSSNKMSLSKISMCILQENPDADYHAASVSEGTLAGYLGIKSESSNQFSISIASSESSQLLFSSLIKDIKILGYFSKGSDGKSKVFHKFKGESHTKNDFVNIK